MIQTTHALPHGSEITRLTFLAPRLPPAVCGLADHTQWLAEAMAEQGLEVGFIHTQQNAPELTRLPGPVDCWDGRRRSLAGLLIRQRADWLWVQLSGYGYSRWGAPLILGQAISWARRRIPELRVAVCATRPTARSASWDSRAQSWPLGNGSPWHVSLVRPTLSSPAIQGSGSTSPASAGSATRRSCCRSARMSLP